MKKTILLYLLFSSGFLFAQNKNLQATVYYNKAEIAYNNKNFGEVVNYLNQAEEILGQPNPKILYLKIQGLNELVKGNSKKVSELKEAIAQFYEIVVQATYPADKYLDIVTIEVELKEREQRARDLEKKEEILFEKLKLSDDLDDIRAFLNRNTNPRFEEELRPIYKKLYALKTPQFFFCNPEQINDCMNAKDVTVFKAQSGKTKVGYIIKGAFSDYSLHVRIRVSGPDVERPVSKYKKTDSLICVSDILEIKSKGTVEVELLGENMKRIFLRTITIE